MDVKQLLFNLVSRTALRHEGAFMKQLAEILKLMLSDWNSPSLHMDIFFFLLLSPTATSVALFKLSLLLLPRVPGLAQDPSNAYLTCCYEAQLAHLRHRSRVSHPTHINSSLQVAPFRKLASPSVPGIFTPFTLSFGPFQANATA